MRGRGAKLLRRTTPLERLGCLEPPTAQARESAGVGDVESLVLLDERRLAAVVGSEVAPRLRTQALETLGFLPSERPRPRGAGRRGRGDR